MKAVRIILFVLLVVLLGIAGAAKILGISWREFSA